MMNTRSTQWLTAMALAACLALAPAPAAAETVLGDDGSLYTVSAGSYGELFGDAAQPPRRSVLAVDVTGPGGTQRLLVPGTTGHEVDGAARLLFEPSSNVLYVVWEARKASGAARLMLAGLDTSAGSLAWDPPVEISGDVTALKGTPQLTGGNETYVLPSETHPGQLEVHRRSVLHVVWWEERAGGEQIFYSPLVFEDGRFVGWNPVAELAELAPYGGGKAPEPIASELLRSPRVAPGRDVHSILVGFVHQASGRLLVVEARTLPGEIGFVAERMRSQIIEIGRTGGPREEILDKIQQKMRSQIIEIGHRFNPRVVQEVAQRSAAEVRIIAAANPNLPWDVLADRMRSQIIEIGADLLADQGAPRHPIQKTYEISQSGQAGAEAVDLSHLVRLRLVADLPAPPAELARNSGQSRIYVAEDAERILVSWTDGSGATTYTESRPGAVDTATAATPADAVWTTPRRLPTGPALTAGDVDSILEKRVGRRR
jgi:hypothetical protein